jgi:hypothetical protein
MPFKSISNHETYNLLPEDRTGRLTSARTLALNLFPEDPAGGITSTRTLFKVNLNCARRSSSWTGSVFLLPRRNCLVKRTTTTKKRMTMTKSLPPNKPNNQTRMNQPTMTTTLASNLFPEDPAEGISSTRTLFKANLTCARRSSLWTMSVFLLPWRRPLLCKLRRLCHWSTCRNPRLCLCLTCHRSIHILLQKRRLLLGKLHRSTILAETRGSALTWLSIGQFTFY